MNHIKNKLNGIISIVENQLDKRYPKIFKLYQRIKIGRYFNNVLKYSLSLITVIILKVWLILPQELCYSLRSQSFSLKLESNLRKTKT